MPTLVSAILTLAAELKRYNDAHCRPKPRHNEEVELFHANYEQTEIQRDIESALNSLQSNLSPLSPIDQTIQRPGPGRPGEGKVRRR
jgi:hypothetical protein